MKLQKKIFKELFIAFAIMACFSLTMNAQSTANIVDNSDDSGIVRFGNLEPVKILLVYESDLITLETTSAKSKLLKTKSNSTRFELSSDNNLSSLLAVEMEKDIELEDWMLKPFVMTKNINNYSKVDTEEDLEVESWMYDLQAW